MLRVRGVGLIGLSLPSRLRAATNAGAKAKSPIVFFLEGCPAHQVLWDMKPDALEGIRGEFRPIATSVPGLKHPDLAPI